MLLWSKRSEQTASQELTTGRTKSSPTEKNARQLRWKYPTCSPNFKLETPRLHSGAARDRPETIETPNLPQIPEVFRQQPSETFTNQGNLSNTHKDSTIYYIQQILKTTVASQASPPKGTTTELRSRHGTPSRKSNRNEPLTASRTVLPTSKIQNSIYLLPLLEIQQFHLLPLQPH